MFEPDRRLPRHTDARPIEPPGIKTTTTSPLGGRAPRNSLMGYDRRVRPHPPPRRSRRPARIDLYPSGPAFGRTWRSLLGGVSPVADAMIYIADIGSAEPAGTAMQRVTITIDDELMTELDRIKGEGTCRASCARSN